ncbi:MAG: LemA family protein, partial [Clostridia bacterium]|nr:LemA family protein [Clostridia bacterium]
MANMLDELDPAGVRAEGLDVHVINRRIPVKVGVGSLIFEILLWVLGILPGLIFLFMKIGAKNYLQQLEQKIQHDASQIDNYLSQRVVILSNCARLIDRAVSLDRDTFEAIARYRGGVEAPVGGELGERAERVDGLSRSLRMAVESYPELRAHNEIQDAMQQNMYLQREITAARELYNDTINAWNREIFKWPTKMIVAARNEYTTRIPFIASE